MFEIKHLKTLTTLSNTGNIRKAADALFVSQSALSHQLKDLEQRLNTQLFIRNTSPVQFTEKGQVLLTLANNILPKISTALNELKTEKSTITHLNLAIACHACFQWLLPITEQFSQQYPKLKLNFMEQTFFGKTSLEQAFPKPITNKPADDVDILFIDEKNENDNYIYQSLGTYEVVAVLAKESETTAQDFLSAADFSHYTLLTYPVKIEELDLFKLFLNKKTNQESGNKYKPKAIKQVANSHMILQMVAANMGIAVLPKWLVNSLSKQSLVQTKRIGETGIYKTLYARYQAQSPHIEIIEQLIPQTISAFERLNKAEITE
jgi:LysR family transcriptional regulator for metE and metH